MEFNKKSCLLFLTASLVVLSSCENMSQDNKNVLGGLLGGAGGAAAGRGLGGAVGGRTAKNIGAVLGAAAGAYIGYRIAKNLSKRDQAAMHSQTDRVMATAPDDKPVAVILPDSGKTLTITPGKISTETKKVSIKRITQVSAPPSRMALVDKKYYATANLNLRTSPSVQQKNVIGSFAKGQTVHVVGTLPGTNWAAISRSDGALIGYASAAYLSPSKPAAGGMDLDQQTNAGMDLDTPTSSAGFNLDSAPATQEVVVASTTCRKVSYNLDDKTEAGRICKTPSGAWDVG